MSIITTKASSILLRKSKHFIHCLLWFWREAHWVKISSGPSSLHLPCLGIKGHFEGKKDYSHGMLELLFSLCKNSRNWRPAWLNNLRKVTWIRPNWQPHQSQDFRSLCSPFSQGRKETCHGRSQMGNYNRTEVVSWGSSPLLYFPHTHIGEVK